MLVAQDAECLLLDEPISALDIAHQIEVLSLVQRLSHSKGLGVVLVLHDVNMAARFCDEILALHSGQADRAWRARGDHDARGARRHLWRHDGRDPPPGNRTARRRRVLKGDR